MPCHTLNLLSAEPAKNNGWHFSPKMSFEPTTVADSCNMRHPSEKHHKLKSREISFSDILSFTCPIVVKVCTEHGSDTAVLCAKFQNDLTAPINVMDARDFTRDWICDACGYIYYVTTSPSIHASAAVILSPFAMELAWAVREQSGSGKIVFFSVCVFLL